MTQMTLFVPGLLTPLRGGERQHPFEAVAAMPLWQMFRRARAERSKPVDGLWAAQCQVEGFPWALWFAKAANLPQADAHWLCADPLQIRVEHRGMFAMGHPQPPLSAQETTDLVRDLNAWLQQDGCELFAPDQGPWLLRLPELPGWQAPALTDIVGVDLAHLLPRTPEGLRWQSRLMEWQMLLQNHPVNLARREKGWGEVSGLWLSGAGDAQSPQWPGYGDVITDNAAIAAWAHVNGATVHAPDTWGAAGNTGACLVFLSALQLPFAHGQRAAWQNAYQNYSPFFERLSTQIAGLEDLVLHPDDGFSYQLGRADRWKFWRNTQLRARHAEAAGGSS